MKRIFKLIAVFLSEVLMLGSICGCAVLKKDPPSTDEIQAIFDRDKDALLLVTEYIVSTGYVNFYVDEETCTTARANLTQVSIEDDAVVAALKQLVKNGYQSINKHGNTVSFCVWSRFNNIGCGLAYSVDGNDIYVQFMTESAPLSEAGWFYYVDDYNEWRLHNS